MITEKIFIVLAFLMGMLFAMLLTPPREKPKLITIYTPSDILYLHGDSIYSESGLIDTVIKNERDYSNYVENVTAFHANNPIQTILNQIDSQIMVLNCNNSLDSLIKYKINEFGITDSSIIKDIYEIYSR